jgi:hypothetical protein
VYSIAHAHDRPGLAARSGAHRHRDSAGVAGIPSRLTRR